MGTKNYICKNNKDPSGGPYFSVKFDPGGQFYMDWGGGGGGGGGGSNLS